MLTGGCSIRLAPPLVPRDPPDEQELFGLSGIIHSAGMPVGATAKLKDTAAEFEARRGAAGASF